jgi:hypothetical protein
MHAEIFVEKRQSPNITLLGIILSQHPMSDLLFKVEVSVYINRVMP